MAPTPLEARARDGATAAWWALCLLHLVPGAVALVAPGWFAAEVAGIPTAQPHFARDVGVAELALAAAAATAALRPSARGPLALVLAVHVGLHALSHVLDRAAAPPLATVLVAASLAAQAALLRVGYGRGLGRRSGASRSRR